MATSPVTPAVTLAGAVRTGVRGAGTTVRVALPGAEATPRELVTLQLSVRLPADPTVKVREVVP